MRQVYKRLNTLLNVAYASFGIKIYVLTSLEINVLLLQCENYYGILKKKKKLLDMVLNTLHCTGYTVFMSKY